ncbi:DUF2971 domain-containing protein [Granulosicoccus sp. 3-233]|uniref:DUF2971 domain-containing protein n=1 Tax=Granulosicoccus sp. 3-233 TaxID=3417969 RepID=UPI003D33BD80
MQISYPEEYLYHYTGAGSLPHILIKDGGGKSTLYATHMRFLNDESEFLTGLAVLNEVLESHSDKLNIDREFLEYLIQTFEKKKDGMPLAGHYVTCFSSALGLVDQWRGYADQGLGFALGYKQADLKSMDERYENVHFLQCIYDEDKQIEAVSQAIETEFAELPANISTDKEVHGFVRNALYPRRFSNIAIQLLRIKHPAYKQEQEWRLIVAPRKKSKSKLAGIGQFKPKLNFRSNSRGLVPYYKVKMPDLQRIVVGPSAHQRDNVLALELLLEERGASEQLRNSVQLENIPFRA